MQSQRRQWWKRLLTMMRCDAMRCDSDATFVADVFIFIIDYFARFKRDLGHARETAATGKGPNCTIRVRRSESLRSISSHGIIQIFIRDAL